MSVSWLVDTGSIVNEQVNVPAERPVTTVHVLLPALIMELGAVEYKLTSSHFGNEILIIPPTGISFLGVTERSQSVVAPTT